MEIDQVPYQLSKTERELIAAFNMCIKTAVYVLEAAENLSPVGRRSMIKELKKLVAEIEIERLYKVAQREINNRNRAETSLWMAARRFQSLIESANDIVMIWSKCIAIHL